MYAIRSYYVVQSGSLIQKTQSVSLTLQQIHWCSQSMKLSMVMSWIFFTDQKISSLLKNIWQHKDVTNTFSNLKTDMLLNRYKKMLINNGKCSKEEKKQEYNLFSTLLYIRSYGGFPHTVLYKIFLLHYYRLSKINPIQFFVTFIFSSLILFYYISFINHCS